LGADKFNNDVERARQNERKEKTEACQIGVPLGAVGIDVTSIRRRHLATRESEEKKEKNWIVLEFPRRQPSVCSDILDHSLLVVFGEIGLGGYAEHSLERVDEENTDEAGWVFNILNNILEADTCMKEILRPYAIFATNFDSERNVNKRFLRPYGRGATRRQKVPIFNSERLDMSNVQPEKTNLCCEQHES
jgi:hypothetical protein